MKIALIFSFALVLFAPSAFSEAEQGTRGGENAVVCFNNEAIPMEFRDRTSPRYGLILDDEVKNNVVSVEAYDLYEARAPKGLNGTPQEVIQTLPGEPVRGYAERIARRFERYVPAVAYDIREGAAAFPDSKILMRPAGLKRVHDENDVGDIDDSHCVIATMAAQYEAGQDTYLQIDGRLFNHPMQTTLSRAVLFLHEALYYRARRLGQTDSLTTRTAVSHLINAAPIDSAQLAALWQSLGFAPESERDGSAVNYLLSLIAPEIDSAVKIQQRGVSHSSAGAKVTAQFAMLRNKYRSSYITNFDTFEDTYRNLTGTAKDRSVCTMIDPKRSALDQLFNPLEIPDQNCARDFGQVYKSYLIVKRQMLASATAGLQEALINSIYPKLETLPPSYQPIKASIKTILEKAIQASVVESPVYSDNGDSSTTPMSFDFSQGDDWQTDIMNLSVPISS